jgi:hypothetical protein
MQLIKTFLGQFQNVSGRFAVSDPCYGKDARCRGELDNVRRGTWNAEVGIYDAGDWGKRVALLIATHIGFDEDAEGDYGMKIAEFRVGVDSGQAGIFDALHYRDDSVFDEVEKQNTDSERKGEKWYEFCCNATTNTPFDADVIPFGVVSSTGYGDGVYECNFWLDSNDEIIKVVMTFIGEED